MQGTIKCIDHELFEGRGCVFIQSAWHAPWHSKCSLTGFWIKLRYGKREVLCFKIIKNISQRPLVASSTSDITYSYNACVIIITPILLNFQNFPQAMDHALVSGYIGIVDWSLIYIELWTRWLNVTFNCSGFKGDGEGEPGGDRHDNSLGDLPIPIWKAAWKELSLGRGSPSNRPAFGTIYVTSGELLSLSFIFFPL